MVSYITLVWHMFTASLQLFFSRSWITRSSGEWPLSASETSRRSLCWSTTKSKSYRWGLYGSITCRRGLSRSTTRSTTRCWCLCESTTVSEDWVQTTNMSGLTHSTIYKNQGVTSLGTFHFNKISITEFNANVQKYLVPFIK